MMGFDGTVQYMAPLSALMPMLAAIIGAVMEVPAAILIVLAFSPVRWRCCLFSHAGYGGDYHHYWDMTGDAVGPNMINSARMSVSLAHSCCWQLPGQGRFLLDRR